MVYLRESLIRVVCDADDSKGAGVLVNSLAIGIYPQADSTSASRRENFQAVLLHYLTIMNGNGWVLYRRGL